MNTYMINPDVPRDSLCSLALRGEWCEVCCIQLAPNERERMYQREGWDRSYKEEILKKSMRKAFYISPNSEGSLPLLPWNEDSEEFKKRSAAAVKGAETRRKNDRKRKQRATVLEELLSAHEGEGRETEEVIEVEGISLKSKNRSG